MGQLLNLRSHNGHVCEPTHGEDERIQSSQLSYGPGDLVICTLQVSKGRSERLAHLHTWGLMEVGRQPRRQAVSCSLNRRVLKPPRNMGATARTVPRESEDMSRRPQADV